MGRIGVVAAQQLFRHPGTGDNYAITSSQSFVFRDEKKLLLPGALPRCNQKSDTPNFTQARSPSFLLGNFFSNGQLSSVLPGLRWLK